MRQTLAGFATGLSVVAAEIDGRIVGMPANSLASISLEPPLVALAFTDTSTTWPVLQHAPTWGISILSENQAAVLNALRRPTAERFKGVETVSHNGAVHILGALATLTVRAHDFIEAGDHTLALLTVTDLRRDESQRPLVFFNSQTHTLSH
ncbi:flavin reductase family protein [Microbacterium enclense]|uniref:flavin reductase family protein n=1 Tax=Microbacterium enclense TaxID=993073 RepID=UPI0036D7C883